MNTATERHRMVPRRLSEQDAREHETGDLERFHSGTRIQKRQICVKHAA